MTGLIGKLKQAYGAGRTLSENEQETLERATRDGVVVLDTGDFARLVAQKKKTSEQAGSFNILEEIAFYFGRITPYLGYVEGRR